MWNKNWYSKKNISCVAHLLNGLLETGVSWDYAIVVSAGRVRKLWDSPSEVGSSICERRQFWGLRHCLSNCALYSVSQSGMTSHSKIAQFNWECIGRLRGKLYCFLFQGLIRKGLRVEMKWGSLESNIFSCRTVFYFLYTGTLAQNECRRSVLSLASCIWMNFVGLSQYDATVTF